MRVAKCFGGERVFGKGRLVGEIAGRLRAGVVDEAGRSLPSKGRSQMVMMGARALKLGKRNRNLHREEARFMHGRPRAAHVSVEAYPAVKDRHFLSEFGRHRYTLLVAQALTITRNMLAPKDCLAQDGTTRHVTATTPQSGLQSGLPVVIDRFRRTFNSFGARTGKRLDHPLEFEFLEVCDKRGLCLRARPGQLRAAKWALLGHGWECVAYPVEVIPGGDIVADVRPVPAECPAAHVVHHAVKAAEVQVGDTVHAG